MNKSKTATKQTTPCLCGCGEQSKGNYRPGHDARHAGQAARLLATGDSREYDRLPTEALRTKATNMQLRLRNKADAKANGKAELGTVKAGRWDYPARRRNGIVQRNTKRDGTGKWVKVSKGEFVPAS